MGVEVANEESGYGVVLIMFEEVLEFFTVTAASWHQLE
jgi:hypothetical protein